MKRSKKPTSDLTFVEESSGAEYGSWLEVGNAGLVDIREQYNASCRFTQWFFSTHCQYCVRRASRDLLWCESCFKGIQFSESPDSIFSYSNEIGCWLNSVRTGAFWPTRVAEKYWLQNLRMRWPGKPPFEAMVVIPTLRPRPYFWQKLILNIAAIWRLPILPILIKRPHMQHILSWQERRNAPQFIFWNPNYSQIHKHVPQKILLVDDVCTSGTTLAQAKKILHENGIEKIEVSVFAKVRNLRKEYNPYADEKCR